MNLGAGAENSEYSYLYAEVNREYSVDMTLELYHDPNGDGIFNNDELLYKYEPDEPQWWITGFDPLVQNVKADDLKAVTIIDFSSYDSEKGELFYEAFKEANYIEKRDAYDEWIWNDDNLIVTLDWRDQM